MPLAETSQFESHSPIDTYYDVGIRASKKKIMRKMKEFTLNKYIYLPVAFYDLICSFERLMTLLTACLEFEKADLKKAEIRKD